MANTFATLRLAERKAAFQKMKASVITFIVVVTVMITGYSFLFTVDAVTRKSSELWTLLFFALGMVAFIGPVILLAGLILPRIDRSLKLQELKEEWAEAHGLDPKNELPHLYFFTHDGEKVFTQQQGNELFAYRLVVANGEGLLYDAQGNLVKEEAIIRPQASEASLPQEDFSENEALWKVARGSSES